MKSLFLNSVILLALFGIGNAHAGDSTSVDEVDVNYTAPTYANKSGESDLSTRALNADSASYASQAGYSNSSGSANYSGSSGYANKSSYADLAGSVIPSNPCGRPLGYGPDCFDGKD